MKSLLLLITLLTVCFVGCHHDASIRRKVPIHECDYSGYARDQTLPTFDLAPKPKYQQRGRATEAIEL